MIQHIQFIEDTVITLAEESRESISYDVAIETVSKLIKKRKIEERTLKNKIKESKQTQEKWRSARLNRLNQQQKNKSEKELEDGDSTKKAKENVEDQEMDIDIYKNE